MADLAADDGARAIGADADRLRLVGAAMVPAPIARSELPGHRQQIGKSAALTVGDDDVGLLRRFGAAANSTPKRSELPGHRQRSSNSAALTLANSMSSSVARFSGWRSRSLSLGEGLTDSTGPRDGTRAGGGWIEGGAGFFLFSLPPAYADPRGMKHKPDQVFEHRGGVLFLVSLPPAYADPRGMKHKPDQVFEHRGGVLFLVSVLPGGAVELPGRSRPAPGVVDLRGVGSMSSSVARFSGWRSRSLSLGEGLTDSTGPRDGTRADGGLDRGRRRL